MGCRRRQRGRDPRSVRDHRRDGGLVFIPGETGGSFGSPVTVGRDQDELVEGDRAGLTGTGRVGAAVLSLGAGSVRFMPNRWTAGQVLALAPDASSRQAAVRLAGAARWGTGSAGEVIWGLCAGSGQNPYQTVAELTGPASRCSCPSRKFPCKHALALLCAGRTGWCRRRRRCRTSPRPGSRPGGPAHRHRPGRPPGGIRRLPPAGPGSGPTASPRGSRSCSDGCGTR